MKNNLNEVVVLCEVMDRIQVVNGMVHWWILIITIMKIVQYHESLTFCYKLIINFSKTIPHYEFSYKFNLLVRL
jgi:hypothetical protein